MASIQWVTAAPLWGAQNIPLTKPWLTEFDGDRFLPDFLDLMASKTPGALAQKKPPTIDIDGKGTMRTKLYQPLHGAYYLVTGSLVCRKLGLPDRTVVRKNGEKTSFVLRRMMTDTHNVTEEYGWVKDSSPSGGSWQKVVDKAGNPNRLAVVDHEERLPLHPVKVCAPLQLTTGFSATPAGQGCDQRTVYYGYIPVASREQYLTPIADPAATLQRLIDAPPSGTSAPTDPRLDELSTRVIEPWRGFYVKPANNPSGPPPPDNQRGLISFYLLLDLLDFLKKNLFSVFEALATDGSGLTGTKRKALLNELQSIIQDQHQDGKPDVFLANLLNGLKPSLPLVQGQGDEPSDFSPYNLYAAQHDLNHDPQHRNWQDVRKNNAAYLTPPSGSFYTLFRDALDEEKQEKKDNGQPWLNVPDEVSTMLKDDPPSGDQYFIRLVYEYDPCLPAVSEESEPFIFARIFDPDAPARQIRIELPSIGIKNLRKFKRGVGIQMPPDLRALMTRVNTGMVTGGGLLSGDTFSLAMICSFSIPIITLVAFIVMFIFLILFNIIFWWLPFLKICFPVPKE